tara:strand:- start:3780 stop:4016 length:237 start_codon:yes stop_codon:yes gene_type:complete
MEISMKIKMLKDIEASSNMSGNATRIYKNNEIIDCDADWKVEIGKNFVNSNFAIEVKIDAPKETKKKVVKKKTTKKAK